EARVWTSSKFTLFNARNRPYAVCTISLDITERAERERQLELFRHAIASANSGTVILEDRGQGLAVSFCSEQLCLLLGISSGTLIGGGLTEFFYKIRMQPK